MLGALSDTKGLESPSADRRRAIPWPEGIWGEFCHCLQGNRDFTAPAFSYRWLCTHTHTHTKVTLRIDTGILESLRTSIRDSRTLARKHSSCISPLRNTTVVCDDGSVTLNYW